MLLFKIGFLSITLWDILDILIVGYLMFQLYKLLKGSIAFNILIGIFTLFAAGWIVRELDMGLLSAILGKFANVGVLIFIIIFQPEARRFLVLLGNTTLRQRSKVLDRLLNRSFDNSAQRQGNIDALKSALLRFSRDKTGALIVLNRNMSLEGLISSGVRIDGLVSQPLLESIFQKYSPMHDGAVVIGQGKVQWASCVLPVSDSQELPKSVGLRHRASVGITERAGVAAFVVSEETGNIAFAYGGQLERRLDEARLSHLLGEHCG